MEYRIRVGGAADTWQRWPSCHQQEATKASGLPERLGTARIRGLRRDGRLPRTERPVGGTPHWRRGHVAAIELRKRRLSPIAGGAIETWNPE
jgi:hypothetical protein